MAKTGIWLRGARGKLAGNVLFKGENAAIIRENVTPRNPQSAKQMLQRVAFATVSQAAKFILNSQILSRILWLNTFPCPFTFS